MSPSLAGFLLFYITITLIIGGIIFVNLGYRFNRKLQLIKTGWIIIGVTSLLFTLLGIYIGVRMYSFSLLFILFGPFVIIIGLIVLLVFGVYNVIIGFRKPINKSKITSGFVCIGIHLAIVTTFIVLLVMFATGVIPIRLM